MNLTKPGTRAKINSYPPKEGSVVDSEVVGHLVYVQMQDLNHDLGWYELLAIHQNVSYLSGPRYMSCPKPKEYNYG